MVGLSVGRRRTSRLAPAADSRPDDSGHTPGVSQSATASATPRSRCSPARESGCHACDRARNRPRVPVGTRLPDHWSPAPLGAELEHAPVRNACNFAANDCAERKCAPTSRRLPSWTTSSSTGRPVAHYCSACDCERVVGALRAKTVACSSTTDLLSRPAGGLYGDRSRDPQTRKAPILSTIAFTFHRPAGRRLHWRRRSSAAPPTACDPFCPRLLALVRPRREIRLLRRPRDDRVALGCAFRQSVAGSARGAVGHESPRERAVVDEAPYRVRGHYRRGS